MTTEPQDESEARQITKRDILELYNANDEPLMKCEECDGNE